MGRGADGGSKRRGAIVARTLGAGTRRGIDRRRGARDRTVPRGAGLRASQRRPELPRFRTAGLRWVAAAALNVDDVPISTKPLPIERPARRPSSGRSSRHPRSSIPLPRFRVARRIVAALVLSFGLAGCVSAGITKVADGVGAVGTFVVGAPDGTPRPVQLFVASNRKGERGAAAQASADNALRYSLTTVSVPPAHKPGSIELPGLGSPNVSYHFVVTGRRSLDEEAFSNTIASHLSGRIGSNRGRAAVRARFRYQPGRCPQPPRADRRRRAVRRRAGALHLGLAGQCLCLRVGPRDGHGLAGRAGAAHAGAGARARRRPCPHPRPFDGSLARHGGAAGRTPSPAIPTSTAISAR